MNKLIDIKAYIEDKDVLNLVTTISAHAEACMPALRTQRSGGLLFSVIGFFSS
jgi:hypothetical protein